jgi:hypothetical protein
MLSDHERRSLRDIEREELARDPNFMSDVHDSPPRRRRRRFGAAMHHAPTWIGPFLVVAAAVLTVPLMAMSPSWAVVGIGVAAVGLVLSIAPGARLLARVFSAATPRRRRPA